MSLFLQPAQKTWQNFEKDDSATIMSTQYRVKEVLRWDIFMAHLWRRSCFVNCFDPTSDANCPNNLKNSIDAQFEFQEIDDWKVGRNYVAQLKIQGITKDSGGSPLGGVTVELFRTADDTKQDTCVSDSAGNYVLYTIYNEPHYVRAFKSPNLAGSTVESLSPS